MRKDSVSRDIYKHLAMITNGYSKSVWEILENKNGILFHTDQVQFIQYVMHHVCLLVFVVMLVIGIFMQCMYICQKYSDLSVHYSHENMTKNLILYTDRSGGENFDGYKSIILSNIWYFYGCMEIQYYGNTKRDMEFNTMGIEKGTMYGMIENEKG